MGKMIDIVFIILNYNTFEETINCVSSIEEKLDTDNYKVIIVDNNSLDNSGRNLCNLYKSNPNVLVIINKDNLGFAAGNNTGIRYAKENYGPRFICVMNSDTLIIQDDFFEVIQDDYKKYAYYVMGPDIVTLDGRQCNPLGNHVLNIKETNRKIISLKVQIMLNMLGIDKSVERVMRIIKNTGKNKKEFDRTNYYTNVKLHGCCLIFGPEYIKNYDGFYEGTFLFLEEDLLFVRMMREERLTLYSPKLKINHLEDASTNKMVKGRAKRLFVLQNHLKSMIVINEYLKGNRH